MPKDTQFWRPGEMAAIARLAQITPANLSATLHRRRGVSKKRAYELQHASECVLGSKRIVRADHWLFSEVTTHPAFFGKAHQRFNPKKRGLKTGGRYGAE